MCNLNSFKNLTLTLNGRPTKIFENKDYAKEENLENPDNLLYLIKDYGHLLMRNFPELRGKGESIIGYFINESAGTPDYSDMISESKDKFFLFESYNVHT